MTGPDAPGPPDGRRPARRHDRLVILVCGAVALVAVVVGLLWSLLASSGASDAADPDAADPDAADPAVVLGEVDDLREHVGDRVVATGAEVDGVPADEGFWVEADGDRVWVQVDTAGESPFTVQEGQRVDFTGTVVAHEADFAQQPDFPAADAEELVDAGVHVEVDVADLRTDG